MPLIETGTMLTAGTLLGRQAFKKAVVALEPLVAKKTRVFIQELLNDAKLKDFYERLSQVRNVKTLAQLDKSVDVMDFYCDSHVYIAGKRKKINSVSDFPRDRCILIQGIAGQGKSIFLRYLCSVELMKGDVIALFLELRKINSGESLIEFIIRSLAELDVIVDKTMLNDLLKSGRLLILLDAFDELREDLKRSICVELDGLVARISKLRMVITSRPNSGLEMSSRIVVAKLSDLENQEYQKVIYKIADNLEVAEQLIAQVEAHKGGIKNLLITPLLVTLLVIQFKSYQVLPDQLSGFYESLLQVLLQRHDGVKLGFKRNRNCKLNDYKFRQLFEAFCFQSKSPRFQSLNEVTIRKLSEQAAKKLKIQEDASLFIDDVVDVTCLIVRDGNEYRFIHKSVQEYYAASYIKQLSDVLANELYETLFSAPYGSFFRQELSFLKEIDAYRYYKHGVLKFLCSMFSCEENRFLKSPAKADFEVIEKLLRECYVTFMTLDNKHYLESFQMVQISPLTFADEIQVYNSLTHAFALTMQPALSLKEANQIRHSMKVSELISQEYIDAKTLNKAVEKFSYGIFALGKQALDFTAENERRSLISAIDGIFGEE